MPTEFSLKEITNLLNCFYYRGCVLVLFLPTDGSACTHFIGLSSDFYCTNAVQAGTIDTFDVLNQSKLCIPYALGQRGEYLTDGQWIDRQTGK